MDVDDNTPKFDDEADKEYIEKAKAKALKKQGIPAKAVANLAQLKAKASPKATASAPETSAPKTKVDAPKTKVDAPKTKVDAPKTKVDAPKTKVDAPKAEPKSLKAPKPAEAPKVEAKATAENFQKKVVKQKK